MNELDEAVSMFDLSTCVSDDFPACYCTLTLISVINQSPLLLVTKLCVKYMRSSM